MNAQDHAYYVDKLEQRERQLRVYEECFADFHAWFNKNRKLLKTIPVSKLPRNPLNLKKK